MQRCEINEVVNLLTDAFETNPVYSSIFKPTNLREGLIWIFGTDLFLLNRRKIVTQVVKEKNSGEIVGTLTLIPPGGTKRTFSDYLHAGLPQFIYRFGFSALYRMLGLENYNKKILTKAVKSKEYYYLSMVAVKKEYKGNGIGSFTVKSCLNELRNTKENGHLLGLTTQLPENVSFYSHLGFEKIDDGEVFFNRNIHYYHCNMKYIF
ncbi:MAG: GNAT family N-acetyltransferase [Planctomycetaceae bacterium]|jgi:GNAT superfamily N-acetyltransferase|nr:GNAT family N-acetyltransferase [Planctomycetaceae bacterium]